MALMGVPGWLKMKNFPQTFEISNLLPNACSAEERGRVSELLSPSPLAALYLSSMVLAVLGLIARGLGAL